MTASSIRRLGVPALAVCMLSCATRQPPRTYGIPGVDYAALQRAALAFRPQTGRCGGSLRIPIADEPASFNPVLSNAAVTREIAGLMYAGLVRFDDVAQEPAPDLAQSWDRSADGRTCTFHLRSGLFWSDSTPLTAFDAAFTFDSLLFNDSLRPGPARDLYSIGGSRIRVTAVDSQTVAVTSAIPYAPLVCLMDFPLLPRHVFRRLRGPDGFASALGLNPRRSDLVGSGPFLLASCIPTQKVILTRNRRYWRTDSVGQRLPYLDSLVFEIVPGQNEQYARFLGGSLDVLPARPVDYGKLRERADRNEIALHCLGPSGECPFLVFNQNPGRDPVTGKPYADPVRLGWFTDPQFRRAVVMGLDRDNMIATVYDGKGYPQWSCLSPSDGFFHSDSTVRHPYDPVKARIVLASAGYRDTNRDSIIEDRGGRHVAFSIVTARGNVARCRIGDAIVRNLQALGMNVSLRQTGPDSLAALLLRAPYGWDAALVSVSSSSDPELARDLWMSSGGLHLWNPAQSAPATPWEASVDSCFRAGAGELDKGKRRTAYDRWQRIVADRLPVIFTVVPERLFCARTGIGNINPSLTGSPLADMATIFLRERPAGPPVDTAKNRAQPVPAAGAAANIPVVVGSLRVRIVP